MITTAIIVLYNPDIQKLDRLYKSLFNQVTHIIFVDNSPTDSVRKENEYWVGQKSSSNYYLSMNDNLGIATAQNQGIEFSKKIKTDFILFLDQDSALPENMVNQLLIIRQKMIDSGMSVFAVGPAFLDEKNNTMSKIIRHKGILVNRITPNQDKDFMDADYIISSGSIIDLNTIDKVGLLDDSLFIDRVDIEWCLRAKKYGLNTYVIPKVIMKHSIGDDYVRLLNINLHSDFRNYFIVRNSLYLALYRSLPLNFRIVQFFKVPAYVLFYAYHSKKPFYALKLLLIAVKDGIFKNMGKGYFKDKGF